MRKRTLLLTVAATCLTGAGMLVFAQEATIPSLDVQLSTSINPPQFPPLEPTPALGITTEMTVPPVEQPSYMGLDMNRARARMRSPGMSSGMLGGAIGPASSMQRGLLARPTLVQESPETQQMRASLHNHQVEIDNLSHQLAAQNTPGIERDELISKIKEKYTLYFDERQKMRAAEIEEIEKRLAALKENHAKRAELKEQIIERRMEAYNGRAQELEWDWGFSDLVPASGGTGMF